MYNFRNIVFKIFSILKSDVETLCKKTYEVRKMIEDVIQEKVHDLPISENIFYE